MLTAVLVTNIVTFSGTLGWQLIERHVAVKEATAGLISRVELASANAKIDELSRRAKIAEDAVDKLNAEVSEAIDDAEKARKGLEDYVQNNTINAKCIVDDKLYKRLRNK